MEYDPFGQVGLGVAGYAPTTAGYAALRGVSQTESRDTPEVSSGRRGGYPPLIQYALLQNADGDNPIGPVGFPRRAIPATPTISNSVDFNISQKDQLRGRYIWEKLNAPDTSAQIPTFFTTLPVRYHLFTLSEYHTFSPSVSNEFRLGYNRYYNVYSVPDIQYPGLAMFPNLTFDDLNGVKVGPDPNAPQGAVQNTYQGADNLSWVHGAHTLKFGAEFRGYHPPATVHAARARRLRVLVSVVVGH